MSHFKNILNNSADIVDFILFPLLTIVTFLVLSLSDISYISLLEFVPVLMTLFAMAMLKRENPWGHIVFFVAQIIFIIYFLQINLPGQVIYCAIWAALNVVGFYSWFCPTKKEKTTVAPLFLRPIWLVAIVVGFAIVPLYSRNGGLIAMLDYSTLYFGIAGQIVLTRKKVDGWILWVIANGVSVGLFWISGSYILLLRAILYLFINIEAFIGWRHEVKKAVIV